MRKKMENIVFYTELSGYELIQNYRNLRTEQDETINLIAQEILRRVENVISLDFNLTLIEKADQVVNRLINDSKILRSEALQEFMYSIGARDFGDVRLAQTDLIEIFGHPSE
jgi:uncharacterized membrane protein